jgi:hypothetical protein
MASTLSVACSSTVTFAPLSKVTSTQRRVSAVSLPALRNFSGLKSNVEAVSVRVATAGEEFARIATSVRGNGKSGVLGARCDLGAEIFPIIPIVSGLVLVGISLGFVLLRVEAAVEESE